MLQRGHHAADFCHPRRIDLGMDDTRLFAAVGQHFAPGIDDQAVAVGLAAARMLAAHRRRQDVRCRFNGTRPEQRVPVHFAGLPLERRRHRNEFRAALPI